MLVFEAFFKALFQVIDLLLTIYIWIIIARAIVSWVNPSPFHPLVKFLYRVTEPVLSPIRRFIPPIYGLDLSPVIVIFAIYFIKELLFHLRFSL